MVKKILVAVDESKNSMKAVNYVAKGMNSSATVTLLSILPDATAACGLDSPALTPLFKEHIHSFCALEDAKKDSGDAKKSEEEDPVPVDFTIVLTDTTGLEYRVKLGDFQNLQPAIKPEVFKSRLFWEDPESEVTLQYVYLPLKKIKSISGRAISAEAIRSISFVFDAEKEGTLLLDQVGFSR